MANPFDRFDPEPEKAGGNPFDQFDPPKGEVNPFDRFDPPEEEPNPFDRFDPPEEEPNPFDRFDDLEPEGDGYTPYAQVREDIDPDSLLEDPDWLSASDINYRNHTGKPFEGSDTELAEWGLDHMGWFNWNLVGTGVVANRLLDADQETKDAFLYMMDTYDNTNVSWGGTGRALKGVFSDPTTYVGIGTLGSGLVAKGGAKVAGKQGIRALIKQGAGRTGSVAAVEGGIYGYADNSIRQGVEVDAGRKEEKSKGELALATGTGVVAGLTLGTAADAGLSGISQSFSRRAASGAPQSRVPDESPDARATVEPEGTPNAKPDATPEGARATDAEGAPEGPDGPAMDTPGEPKPDAPEDGSDIPKTTGRREADEVVPEYPVGGRPGDVVPLTGEDTGQRSTPITLEEINEAAVPVLRSLKETSTEALDSTMEILRRGGLSQEQHRVVARGVQMYADELKAERAEALKVLHRDDLTPEQRFEAEARYEDLERRAAPVELADEAEGSMTGSVLRQRQEGNTDLRGLTVESIMERYDVDRVGAEQLYIEKVAAAESSEKGRQISNKYAAEIEAALASGDLMKANRLTVMRHRELGRLAGLDTKNQSSFMRRLNEVAISNVFSLKTLVINAVPSGAKGLIIPGVRLVLNDPLSRASRANASATYSAMKSNFGGAVNAARSAFRYEQSLLTRRKTQGLSTKDAMERVDSGRFLEEGLAIRGRWAGTLRFFPRALNATDEFFSQINYTGFVAGRAASEAAIEAGERGLKGKELDDYIKDAAERAVEDALRPSDGDELVQPIINKGIQLGFSGEKLVRYVEKEAMRNPAALRRGTDDEALAYTQDVLFKRPFDGDKGASAVAKGYEDMVAKLPSLKFVFGQLFFRTPIRVFESGIRMTPGVQILAPRFLKDLAGDNGMLRQTRARGEALASLGFTAGIMNLYAQGRITGDGAYDHWRQERGRGNTDKAPLYTVTMKDGSTWSYRNFDPVATPMKIMVNALERMDRLAIREAQGEFIDANLYQKAAAQLTVGTTAIAAALRDANLMAGIEGTIEFFETASDPEEEGKWVRLMGEKLDLLVPNTLRKTARENDPTIKDPASFWQTIEDSFKPVGLDFESVVASTSYDALGNPRTVLDSGVMGNIFATVSEEERQRGLPERELVVLRELDRLAQETGLITRVPYTHSMLGNVDLRKIVTEDGEETLYDRWQSNYKDLNPVDALYPLVTADLPDGTFKHKGIRVREIQSIITEYRNAAFDLLLAQEEQVVLRYIKGERNEAETEAGMWDYRR